MDREHEALEVGGRELQQLIRDAIDQPTPEHSTVVESVVPLSERFNNMAKQFPRVAPAGLRVLLTSLVMPPIMALALPDNSEADVYSSGSGPGHLSNVSRRPESVSINPFAV
jgi:hypothetical protein